MTSLRLSGGLRILTPPLADLEGDGALGFRRMKGCSLNGSGACSANILLKSPRSVVECFNRCAASLGATFALSLPVGGP